jgi:hypothetical protein
MELENWRRYRDSRECGNPGSCGGSRRFALEACDVGAVDDKGAASIVRSDGTVVNVAAAEDSLEERFIGSTDFPIQVPSGVGSLDVSRGEHFLLSSYR